MTKIKFKLFYLMAICGTVLFTACDEDKLDILPEIGSPLEHVIQTEDDMRLVLTGVYTQLSSSSGFGAAVPIQGDLLSDNTYVSNDNDGYYITSSRMAYNSEISDFGMYDSFYNVIQQANMVIGDEVLSNSETVLKYKAEAKIARAYSYFYLLNFYSPDPKSGINQEFGVPIQPEHYNPSNRLGRSSITAVYDYIISDLESAISVLGSTESSSNTVLGSKAAKLILSKVYLTRGASGDYQKSIDYSNQVLASAPASPTTSAQYSAYFSDEESPEIIFAVNQTSIFSLGGNAHPSTFYANNGAHACLLFRPSFTGSFQTGDYRAALIGNNGSTQDSPVGKYSKKWVRFISGQGNYTQNIVLLRYSEATLNRIEALYKMGNTADALTYLNAYLVTRNVTTPYTTISIDTILNERRKEFFSEGYRYFDLKRNGLGVEKDSNCEANCSVSANDRLLVIPIPYSETNINSNITQYPGW